MNRLILILSVAVILSANSLRAQEPPPLRTCGDEFGYNDLIAKGGAFAERYQALEQFTQQYIRGLEIQNQDGGLGFDGARSTSIIIPVVVHVLWRDPVENIT